MSFVNVYQFCMCPSSPFCFEGGMWDLILLIHDHCLSIYFVLNSLKSSSFVMTWLLKSNWLQGKYYPQKWLADFKYQSSMH